LGVKRGGTNRRGVALNPDRGMWSKKKREKLLYSQKKDGLEPGVRSRGGKGSLPIGLKGGGKGEDGGWPTPKLKEKRKKKRTSAKRNAIHLYLREGAHWHSVTAKGKSVNRITKSRKFWELPH